MARKKQSLELVKPSETKNDIIKGAENIAAAIGATRQTLSKWVKDGTVDFLPRDAKGKTIYKTTKEDIAEWRKRNRNTGQTERLLDYFFKAFQINIRLHDLAQDYFHISDLEEQGGLVQAVPPGDCRPLISPYDELRNDLYSRVRSGKYGLTPHDFFKRLDEAEKESWKGNKTIVSYIRSYWLAPPEAFQNATVDFQDDDF